MSEENSLFYKIADIMFIFTVCLALISLGICTGFAIRDYQYRDCVKIVDGKVIEVNE